MNVGSIKRHLQVFGMEHQPQSVLASGPDRRANLSPAEMLRAQVCSSHDLSVLTEAQDTHSCCATAKRAGFKGFCASGRSLACSPGYRNADEASWGQLVDVVERIVESTEPPVLVVGDSDFRHFNKAPILARKLRQRGFAGIGLGHSRIPKMSSALGECHPVAGR
ncbi:MULTISPECIES: isocitrate lyase/phosphoenolpyruvate mutase family protein [Bradyrhizobium]|uniref:isocitrate lyase/phosphoenolpyruvate mutase family protein n=1 Tax=Bradyrhizobium TaxID=374 RepID=UPI001E41648D|nr:MULTISPECIES: isocitrate lyase/phosphoenolpyruvate mutase family protein [Bradyrhizobium]